MRNYYFVLILCLISNSLYAENNLPVNWQDLPEPYATKSSVNPARVISQPKDVVLSLPEGFQVEEYLTDFLKPRHMIRGMEDEIILSDMGAGAIYVIRDKQRKVLTKGLQQPYGLALYKQWLYVADVNAVHRYDYDAKTMQVDNAETIISLKQYASGHITRSLLIDEQNEKIYLSIGSGSNVNAGEDEARAAITRYNLDGSGYELYASGIRNAVGMAWNAVTRDLWVSSHERDGLGDDLVPDYLTKVVPGGFYGWPYAYIGPHEDPRRKGEAPELVKKTLYPSVLLGGHVGAMSVIFYTGNQFPAEYHNGAFVALHGSWNRSQLAGYKIVFIPFKDGQVLGGPVDFLSGWMLAPNNKKVWGRPVGLLQMGDGSMLISDDGAGKIWRVTYTKGIGNS